ncbi:hypothetical protein [Rhizobium hainanense]|uniref:Uncharacterized protein n=1 Tax=Rhizobium hainanense TaxID=52131 RepID=A0A1C3V8X3_9HYPH|nr:hypothetical protein [Rhizobium hainanense]SCB24256.1 hypothetical protein GA0061100_10526 [Rhizobium hainanense]
MPKSVYVTGDSIILKNGVFLYGAKKGHCRIVSILPKANGLVQYRIRFSSENCERLITEADIDHDASVGVDGKPSTNAAYASSSWVNINAIKIRK